MAPKPIQFSTAFPLIISELLFAIMILGPVECFSQPRPTKAQLIRNSFQSHLDDRERDFFIYLPEGYEPKSQQKWPVLLFLHGDGERGDGKAELDFLLIHGPIYEAWIHRRDLPFIIVSPQLPMFGRDTVGIPYLTNRDRSKIPRRLESGTPPRRQWSSPSTPMEGAAPADSLPFFALPNGWDRIEEDILTIIDQVQKNFHTDPDRFYLTGLSYGGFGTWYVASKHPELFAAVNPIVGWGHPDLMEPIARANLPVWAVSGGRDLIVQKKYFLPGLNKLEQLGHTNLRYTIHEDLGHDAWRRVYRGEDLYDWLLQQVRNSP